MAEGWISIHRNLLEKGWAKKPEYLALWIHLIALATHKPIEYFWNGETIKLQSGQFITGRNKLSDSTGINPSKIERILKTFESEQQIEQRKTSTSRLISILNYNKYQKSEQRFEQRVNNERTLNNNDNKYTTNVVYIHPLQKFIKDHHPNVSKLKNQLTEKEATNLLTKFTKEEIKDVLMAMENKADLTKKYTSVNLTIQSWIKLRNANPKFKHEPKPDSKGDKMKDFYDN